MKLKKDLWLKIAERVLGKKYILQTEVHLRSVVFDGKGKVIPVTGRGGP
jgi:hypothetical protein